MISFSFLLLFSSVLVSQKAESYKDLGRIIRLSSSNSMFPHSKRMNGHKYGDKSYPYSKHYADSSVLIFIPQQFKASQKTDFLFYFHGWDNSIDQSLKQFELAEQVVESKRNIILVLPEGPKKSNDSFGGKLEETGRFKLLTEDIISTLNRNSFTIKEINSIILSGHSGGYRVMAYILNRGGLTDKISQVILFDGFYGQFEKYAYWLDHFNGRFINIITPSGGTWDDSIDFLQNLDSWKIDYKKINRNNISKSDLDNRITFIFTDLKHNDVINPYLKIFVQE